MNIIPIDKLTIDKITLSAVKSLVYWIHSESVLMLFDQKIFLRKRSFRNGRIPGTAFAEFLKSAILMIKYLDWYA